MARQIICGIYKITNNINGKIYVGQSVNIYKRWLEHRNDFKSKRNRHNIYFQRSWAKYGEANFEFDIIEQCEKEELNNQERYWIKHFNSNDTKMGYNADEGAKGTVINKETKHNMGSSNRGVVIDKRKILQFSLDGTLYKTWNNVKEVRGTFASSIRSIRGCCKMEPKRYTAKGFIWMYEEDYIKDGLNLNYYLQNKIIKEVLQFDLDMNFIKEWNSIGEASKQLKIADWTISFCCSGKKKKASGFIWKYKNSQVNDVILSV